MQIVCDVLLEEELISFLFALALNVPVCTFHFSVIATEKESYGLGALQNSRLLNLLLRVYSSPFPSVHQGSGENYVTMSFMICTPHQILFR